jgi:hypothetical protein
MRGCNLSRRCPEAVLMEKKLMKKIVLTLVALGIVAGVAAPALAAAPTTKAACEKAKMKWDAATKTCK